MTRSCTLSAIALMGILLVPARADECPNANTQTDMNICFDKLYRAADDALNVSYQDVSSRLKSDSQARMLLVRAEQHWLAFLDSECEFESSSTAGGSVHPMILTQCRTTLIKARTQALRRMLSCKEGDLSCPLPPK